MEDAEDRLTHSEEGLKEQYLTLEGIINSVDAPIFSVDGQYRYTSFNKAHKSVMKTIYGKDIEIGRSLLDCMTVAEDREKAKRNLDRALAGEQFVEEAYSGEQTRSRLYFEVSHNPIMTRDGAIIGVTVFAKDITERKHMEEETRISEERYRNLVENSKDSIVMVDMRGNVLFGNRATQELTGYTIEEGVRMNVKDITPLRYWPKSLEMLLKAGTGRPIPYFESAIKRKDGRLVPVETGGQAIRQDGKVVGIQIITRDITERKRAEESLRASEEKYRTLVESLHEGIWAIDKEICTTFVNTRMAEMLGYSVDEMLGKPLFSFVDERGVENARHLFERRREGARETHDFEFIRKDGSRIYTALATSPIMDETGNFVGALAGVIDITERRKMEAELEKYTKHLEVLVEERTSKLAESERRFRELADLLPQIVFEIDVKGDLTFVNRVTFAIMGYTEEELREGLNALQMVAPEERSRVMENIRRILGGEALPASEYMALRKDGSTFPVLIHSSPIIQNGEPVGLRGIIIDITERKRMEEALRASEERFRGIAERSFDLIFTLDQEGRITYASPGGERLFGYASDEGLDKSFQDFIPESQIPKLAQVFASVSKGNSVTGLELEVRRRDGSLASVEINASPILRDGRFAGLQGIARDITERKDMEQKLQDSEERFRGIAERSIDGIFETDLEGRVTYVSPSVETLGYKPEEVIGTRMERYLPESEIPKIAPNMAALMNGMNVLGLQGEMLRKDGTHIPAELNASPIFRDGKIVGVQGIVRDVTERRKMENALREGEERYRRLLESMSEHIAVFDSEWRYLLANEALARSVKIPREQLLGKKVAEVFPGIEKSVFFDAGERVMKSRQPVTVTSEFTFEDERTGWFESHLYPVPEGIMYVAIDITERKQMEDALRISERRFRDLADLLPQIVFEIDENGTVQFMNRAAFAATGCTEEDFREGLNAFHMFAPEEHDRAMRGIRRTMTGETIGGREFTILRRDGTTFPVIVYTARIMRGGKTVGVRGIAIDITERKRMEARLVESQRLAAIGETAAMVGHDLRNPLQGIASTVYLAKKTLKSPRADKRKVAAKLLNTLDEEVYYMDKIVSDLQDYAGPLTADLVETSLSNIIKNTISTTGIPRTVRVCVTVQKGLSKIAVDPTLMRRVLTNLMTNALQAMPQGGRLTIRASKKRKATAITVQDTGEGIPRDNMKKIFSPFFTTKAKGQGLGLAVCKRLVEAQGGTITVKSKVGKGSTFTVEIPARTKPGAR